MNSKPGTNERDSISTLLLIVAIAGLVVGLLPQGGRQTESETGIQVTRWTVGLPDSPLWSYEKIEEADGSHQFKSGFHILSWSWIPVGVAAACLELRKRRWRNRTKRLDEGRSSEP